MIRVLGLLLPFLLGGCNLLNEPYISPRPQLFCVARETVSGACSKTELGCPEPLMVAQKIDGALYCKIKGDAKNFTDPLAKKTDGK